MKIPAVQKWAESFTRDVTMHPGGQPIDFQNPVGEAAMTGPTSVSWQVFKNPIAIFVGGITAVLLELAEPRVRTGVWNHTTFKTDPLARMKRTGLAAMITVFGPRSLSLPMIERISVLHSRIEGTTPCGQPYRADDPALLNWVQATASFGFLESYCAYVRPLSDDAKDRFYGESSEAARAYGAVDAPTSLTDQVRQFEEMRPRLEASPIVQEFLEVMHKVPVLPGPVHTLQSSLVRAAIANLPSWCREALELGDEFNLRRRERLLIRGLGRIADRVVLSTSPPAQACMRLGLPSDYLYHRRARRIAFAPRDEPYAVA